MQPTIITPQQNNSDQPDVAPLNPVVAQPSANNFAAQNSYVVTPTAVEPLAVAAPAAPTVQQPPAMPTQAAPIQMPWDAAQTAAVESQFAAPQKRGHAKAIVATALVVLAVIGAGSYVGFGMTSKANAQSQGQQVLANLNKGDYTAAYAMGSASLKQGASAADFSKAMGDLKTAKPVLQKETTTVNGGTATYTAFQDGLPQDANGGTTGTYTVQLARSGLLNWQVDSINVN